MNTSSDKEKKCKVCGDKTKQVFNIRFKATPICFNCESLIVRQSIAYFYNPSKNRLIIEE